MNSIKSKIRYYLQYVPFTANLLWLTVTVFILVKVLNKKQLKGEIDSFKPLLLLMGKVALGFLIALVSLSLLSTLASWLYSLWLYKKKGHIIEVDFESTSRDGRRNKLFVHTFLKRAVRPLLGFVKGRIVYDNYALTDRFPLLSNRRKEKKWLREGISSKSVIVLPDIKEYDIQSGFIYFEDMLRLLSLPIHQPIKGHFYQAPVLKKIQEKEVYPKKTETLDVRIEQMRRVEGELLHYKDFEAGDDVRRIVWKVYAKNRELVVRTPEMFEPFASHLYMYASFAASTSLLNTQSNYAKEMLNYYKNSIWTVYDTIAAKEEWQVRFIAEQDLQTLDTANEAARIARIISNSQWSGMSVLQYFKPKQGAVLCISSLTDVQELEQLLQMCDNQTLVYFVKTSRAFKHFVAWSWLKRLLFLSPDDRLQKVRNKWLFSPARLTVARNEKRIEAALENAVVTYAVL